LELGNDAWAQKRVMELLAVIEEKVWWYIKPCMWQISRTDAANGQ